VDDDRAEPELFCTIRPIACRDEDGVTTVSLITPLPTASRLAGASARPGDAPNSQDDDQQLTGSASDHPCVLNVVAHLGLGADPEAADDGPTCEVNRPTRHGFQAGTRACVCRRPDDQPDIGLAVFPSTPDRSPAHSQFPAPTQDGEYPSGLKRPAVSMRCVARPSWV